MTRPGGEARPGISTRPNLPTNKLPFPGDRPSSSEIGDFLGLDKPLRPQTRPAEPRPSTRPTRPTGEDRPSLVDRPRPETRPNIGDRPNFNNRPVNIGDINIGNNVAINNRPSWVNLDRDRYTNINNRWQNQISGIHNWQTRYPNRVGYWHGWADGVRGRWGYYHHHGNWFGRDWWYGHNHRWCGWHYGYWFNRRPWSYWWTVPTYTACVRWFTWSAPATVWAQPVYYDYGQGGNVVYQNNTVYINGQQVATADEFAQSAAELATVEPPKDESEAEQVEWLPLGTFAVSSSEKDVEPTRVIQLAVSKEGIISGTLYNTQTDQADTIQGQVDRETQRVAFRIGKSDSVVVETGLYNLTQEEAPALVHFGTDRIENWLLVRLEQEGEDENETTETPGQ